MMLQPGEPFMGAPIQLRFWRPIAPLCRQAPGREQSAVPDPDKRTVPVGFVVRVVGRDQTPRAIHVVDHQRGIAGNMFPDVPGHRPRVGVVASASGKANGDANGFACIEIVLLWRSKHCRYNQGPQRDGQKS